VSWLRGMGADVVTTEQDLKADLGKTTLPGQLWHTNMAPGG
jgi:hypothetical protein